MIPLEPNTSTPHKCPEKKPEALDKESRATPEKESEKVEAPPHRDFNDESIKAEVKIISVWARIQADSINFPKDFDKNSASHDELRARQIDRNVDKKQLFDMFFKLKYDTKKDSVDNVSR